jgi:hypothetical protein
VQPGRNRRGGESSSGHTDHDQYDPQSKCDNWASDPFPRFRWLLGSALKVGPEQHQFAQYSPFRALSSGNPQCHLQLLYATIRQFAGALEGEDELTKYLRDLASEIGDCVRLCRFDTLQRFRQISKEFALGGLVNPRQCFVIGVAPRRRWRKRR